MKNAIRPPIEGLPFYVAHTPSIQNPHWHPLTDHVFGVTDRAIQFAHSLGIEAIAFAKYYGLLHDLGKLTPKFQQYLWDCHAGKGGVPGSAPHKQMGALAAQMDFGDEASVFMLPLFGHHGGMDNPETTKNKTTAKTNEDEVKELRELASSLDSRWDAVPPDLETFAETPHCAEQEAMEMFLRMVFSCLVDADSLDTEKHNDPQAAATREALPPVALEDLRDALTRRQNTDFESVSASVVNTVRREVYDSCISAAALPPGVFSLCVPTGGGKTRSSLAFALEHACKNRLSRVIYAIPFTSIVDQTAGIFRDIFADYPNAVLEHHSAIEPNRRKAAPTDTEGEYTQDSERWRQLSAQNWDAPVIVTTTVQLFESLFANRPGACRKLHRYARSVIVLDEVQTLPPTLLLPLIDGLKTLAANFGTTIVLCTATQPALEGSVSPFLEGFAQIAPIIAPADRDRHFYALSRVTYCVAPEPWDWSRVAQEMQTEKGNGISCLCIVNTRRQALKLLEELDPTGDNPDVFHLSTLMCGRHRRATLETVRERLLNGPPLLLVSTQVVECGVDLDFPTVLRAIGPLDRIIQAAGRCNREGRRPKEESRVLLFTPVEDSNPGGIYQQAIGQTKNLIRRFATLGKQPDFDQPKLVTDYFAQLYSDLQGDLDKKNVQERRRHFDYPEVAERVRLIDSDTVSILVYEYASSEADSIIARCKKFDGMSRALWQQAQPLCVAIYAYELEKLKLSGDIEEYPGSLRVWRGNYHPKTGIPLDRDPSDGVYVPEKLIV